MKSEDAVFRLEGIRNSIARLWNSKPDIEALELAISALRVQPALVGACEELLGSRSYVSGNHTLPEFVAITDRAHAALNALHPTPTKGGTP